MPSMNFPGQGFQKLEHYRQTDRQTDTQTDRQTDRQTDTVNSRDSFTNVDMDEDFNSDTHAVTS